MPTSDTPSFDPNEWDVDHLWTSYINHGEVGLIAALAFQWRDTDRDDYWEDFVAFAPIAIEHFQRIETAEAEHAERQHDQQVARARYGFWKD